MSSFKSTREQAPILPGASRAMARVGPDGGDALPLFRYYPRLVGRLPHVSLGSFPTPVERADRLGEAIGVANLYLKRDDLSGAAYGGNKVRKLEFLLGAAWQAGLREVFTIGFAGSNHALATAIYAGQLGMRSTSMLMPQENARYVRENLLASQAFHAGLNYYSNALFLRAGILAHLWRCRVRTRMFPGYIPAGGASALGNAGYVNAALELAEQVRTGKLPEPDVIYLPLGSSGTCAGLILGLRAAGLRSRVMGVRAIGVAWVPARAVARLVAGTRRLLRRHEPVFPDVAVGPDDLIIRNDCLGPGYAHFTPESVEAARLAQQNAGIKLNGSYSAKALAALIRDADRGLLRGKVVMFWNTSNSRDLSNVVAGGDWRTLPRGFHRYFVEEVQPLDREA